LEPGTRALFITTETKIDLTQWPPFSEEFGPSLLVDDFWARENGRDIKHFHIYLLTARAPGAKPAVETGN